MAGSKGGGGGAGDPGRLVDREGEALGGGRTDTVRGGDGERVCPPVPAAGVPASVAVPSPLSVNVTPGGSAPVSDNVELGTPVVVTVKVPAWPTVKVAPAGLVILGAWLTVRVKAWVASGLTPFVALIVNGYGPPVFAAGVPASVAVPSPLSVNVTPVGSVAVADNMRRGHPGRRDGKGPGLADGKGGEVGAGDLARLVDREGEALGGVRNDIVRGVDRERVGTAGIRSRCSRKCRRAVPVVGERDSRRQCERRGQDARGIPGRRDGKGPGLADGEGGGRRRW